MNIRHQTQCKYKLEIDATGLLCPLPVLKLRKRIKEIDSGEIVKLVTDDPAASVDVPHFCLENNYELLFFESADYELNKNLKAFFIKKS